ncbi:ribosome maturation factor RimM [Spiroplasma tabanidicola]|uniref:Ribosome maturation factor RimM n=1 Tax=Spiroplasma tabanidicola TaxID=324079 RepID=A0A6I6CA25_9MOLU|nr:ribosome maturation factor RimM [Spiroplasma tabanidicola]QGS51761.1 16S rRNA processing protein RimM [Spiroplasma tabanidicola]
MNLDKQLLKVGKLKSTHGIKGEFKFWLDDGIYIIDDLKDKQIFLKDLKNNLDVYLIENFHEVANKLVIKFKGIDNINDALNFIGQEVFFKIEDNLIEHEETLIDFKLVVNNNTIGTVIDEMFNGAQDLVKIKTNDNKQFWVPCVDEYVIEIDYDNKIIYAKNIEILI